MEPKITSFSYHSGAPLISTHSRTPGYRIVGNGFGNKRGEVEIEYARDDETRFPRIKSWSDTLIEIERPGRDPYDWSVWINDVYIIRADGRRSEYFELVRPGIPYYGPIRDQNREAPRIRRAA